MSIVVSDFVTATSSNVLAGTRLQNFATRGAVVIEMECSEADATNNGRVTLQFPDGETPLDNVLVPANAQGQAGVIDNNTEYAFATNILVPGGILLLGFTITGSCQVTYRVTFTPA